MVTAYLIMYLAQYKSLNKKQFCEMNEVNEQKLFFVMIYNVLNTLFKWAVTNVLYTTKIASHIDIWLLLVDGNNA